MTKRKLTNFRIDESLLAGLETVKSRDGIPLAVQVRFAIADWLQRRGVLQSPAKRARPTRAR